MTSLLFWVSFPVEWCSHRKHCLDSRASFGRILSRAWKFTLFSTKNTQRGTGKKVPLSRELTSTHLLTTFISWIFCDLFLIWIYLYFDSFDLGLKQITHCLVCVSQFFVKLENIKKCYTQKGPGCNSVFVIEEFSKFEIGRSPLESRLNAKSLSLRRPENQTNYRTQVQIDHVRPDLLRGSLRVLLYCRRADGCEKEATCVTEEPRPATIS